MNKAKSAKPLAQTVRRKRRKKPLKLTPFETIFPPIKDRKLPKDGAAYL